MKLTKRNFNVTVKLTKDFDSVAFSEGFEVELDGNEYEDEFENEKRRISQRVYQNTKDFLCGLFFEKKTGKKYLKDGKIDIDIDFKSGNEV